MTVELPWEQLLLTGAGYVKAVQRHVSPQNVLSVGVSLADGRDGPFALELAWVKAVRKLKRQARTGWSGENDNAHVLGRATIQSVGRAPVLLQDDGDDAAAEAAGEAAEGAAEEAPAEEGRGGGEGGGAAEGEEEERGCGEGAAGATAGKDGLPR